MGELALILETAMIALFGFSWPNNILKTLQNKSTKGKSLMFLLLIDIGYACGITSKLITTFTGSITTSHLWLWYFARIYFLPNKLINPVHFSTYLI